MLSCVHLGRAGQVVECDTEELNAERRTLLQMLFVEGNHFCPSCEKSGNCKLQATAYELGMMTPHFDHFYPNRPVDASHPRCCSTSTAASSARCACAPAATSMAKRLRALRARHRHKLIVNSPGPASWRYRRRARRQGAAGLPGRRDPWKRRGFAVPIGERTFDKAPIAADGRRA